MNTPPHHHVSNPFSLATPTTPTSPVTQMQQMLEAPHQSMPHMQEALQQQHHQQLLEQQQQQLQQQQHQDQHQLQQQQQEQQEGEEEMTLDVGSEPGSGLAYTGPDGDIRIISREIYQGKTFEDWDDMEANVRRLARKAGFKVVKDSKGEKRADGRQKRIVWKCDCAGIKTPRKNLSLKEDPLSSANRDRPSKRQGCPFQINATWPEKCLQPGVTRCTLEHNHRLSGPLRAGRQDPVLPEELLAEHVSALKEWARIPVAVRTQMQILRHEFFDGRALSLEAQRCVHTLSGQEAPRRRAAAAAAAAAAAPAAMVASLAGSRVNDPIFRETLTIIANALRQALESGADEIGLKRRCEGFADGLKKTTDATALATAAHAAAAVAAAGVGGGVSESVLTGNGDGSTRLAKRPREGEVVPSAAGTVAPSPAEVAPAAGGLPQQSPAPEGVSMGMPEPPAISMAPMHMPASAEPPQTDAPGFGP